jgi:peroxiredoxin
MDIDLSSAFGVAGTVRSKRYSAIIQNMEIVAWNVEPGNGTGLTCSLSNEIMDCI